ncbi:GNAT family N-acetyltransferase [Clostridium sp. YIM B02515]|uniref:GNAT family N-acetyltransferase n=1 Tax=Clostridium rhizosphaerae TaxID=2803861 RepID=A0ABS1T4B8_9CLOT|nr:GNAT family N-acetyltransferase [Clostridium rhizosphaerae]MBL4934165.1 GNAT family N-acetyltransferase [Clostridium rhizosphaerae]
MYKYVKSNIEENKESFSSYLSSLSGIYDEFLEEHILNSEIYSIYVDDVYCGYFGIFNKTLLTQFFITKGFLRHGQKIFVDIIKSYGIKNAFVPTCDELVLTLALDNHLKVNLQAYFFKESGETVKPPKYAREFLKKATLEDIDEIKEITGDFIDKHEERINEGQLYILREDGEFLGLGIIVDNRIIKGCACTGMFTNEKYRQKGIGRSIIMNLMDICREKGLKPLAGCWYYNHNSKRTLESSGYISTTRLLRIDFTEDAGEV